MCGEKPLYLRFDNGIEGSPPHVRGKGEIVIQWLPIVMDHPRMCGEKDTEFAYCVNDVGSPPHVRGKDAPPCQ